MVEEAWAASVSTLEESSASRGGAAVAGSVQAVGRGEVAYA
ncbi:hypothetical protein ACIBK9_02925 [Nonomuraea sp. NPDC050227]